MDRGMTDHESEPVTGKQRAWALVRLILGLLQMMGAVISAYLLLQIGVNALSLTAVVLTCFCTSVSVVLFGSAKNRR
jgi:hypothetical protein